MSTASLETTRTILSYPRRIAKTSGGADVIELGWGGNLESVKNMLIKSIMNSTDDTKILTSEIRATIRKMSRRKNATTLIDTLISGLILENPIITGDEKKTNFWILRALAAELGILV